MSICAFLEFPEFQAGRLKSSGFSLSICAFLEFPEFQECVFRTAKTTTLEPPGRPGWRKNCAGGITEIVKSSGTASTFCEKRPPPKNRRNVKILRYRVQCADFREASNPRIAVLSRKYKGFCGLWGRLPGGPSRPPGRPKVAGWAGHGRLAPGPRPPAGSRPPAPGRRLPAPGWWWPPLRRGPAPPPPPAPGHGPGPLAGPGGHGAPRSYHRRWVISYGEAPGCSSRAVRSASFQDHQIHQTLPRPAKSQVRHAYRMRWF